MSGVVFIPDRNSHGKKDMTGAFRPEARKFIKYWQREHEDEFDLVSINVGRSRKKQEQQVLDAIKAAADSYGALDTVAFFCHGFHHKLQFGFPLLADGPDKLAKVIAENSANTITVPLYCCSTAGTNSKKPDEVASGDGGFADMLRDSLCRHGALENRTMGHTNSGHTTRNPHVRLFDGNGMPEGGTGGYWVVSPGGPLWKKWARILRTEYRFLFPYLDVKDIWKDLTE